MSELRIKICGLTRLADARLAAELGAWALGFVFYPPSPRAISWTAAAEIIAALPSPVLKVGVFVNADFETLSATAQAVGLTHLQLHGNESPELVQALQTAGFQVIKALRLQGPADLADLTRWPAPLLIDAAVPGSWGGTGQTADWDLAAQACRQHRTILAGGLHAGNLLAALNQVQPWAVDLSSGVETAPGIKDATKIQEVFKRVKARAKHANFNRS